MASHPVTIFLLSPANCGAKRAQFLLNPTAAFPLALRLRQGGAPLAEVFSFISGLYFRGKLSYARAFARPFAGTEGVLVIAPGWGLVPAEQSIGLEDLRGMAAVPVSLDEARFREPLERHAHSLASALGPAGTAVLLGSIATGKYIDILERYLGERLHFPTEFVGRGDMSRGGLMLRCAQLGRELEYRPVAGAVRHGSRPPRLEPIPRSPRLTR